MTSKAWSLMNSDLFIALLNFDYFMESINNIIMKSYFRQLNKVEWGNKMRQAYDANTCILRLILLSFNG